MSQISAEEVQRAGLVITLSRKLESRMTELGASASGLHDKTDMLASRLDPETVRLLHFIGALRNRAAHEDLPVSGQEMELFTSACETVMNELEKLPVVAAAAYAATSPAKNTVMPVPPQDIPDVEGELKNRIKNFFNVCCFIPEAHSLYLLWSLGRVALGVASDLAAMLFGILGIVLMADGVRTGDRDYLIIGGLTFAATWLYGLIVGSMNEKCRILPWPLRFLPLLNAAVFLRRAMRKLRFMELVLVAASLWTFIDGSMRIFQRDYRAGLWLFGASYAGSVLIYLLDRFYYSPERKSSSTSRFHSR